MPASLKTIETELNALLQPEQFNDYCPNGLQVQGAGEINTLITGVTACQALVDRAAADNADMLLVHHGYFWRGEDPTLTGIKRARVQALLAHDINLFAYHLPLDVHPELGNNAQLGKLLGLRTSGEFANHNGRNIGLIGSLEIGCSTQDFAELLETRLQRKPLVVDGAKNIIKTIAWCSGAAQNYIEEAVAAGVDAFVTGEVSEPTVHIARESGIAFFSAGHHATERYGVQAVGDYLADKYQLQHQFIDIDNPV
ncbi:MAG: Nif3-like dinuclear metal center hexameric protein [Gammaproteobacteria bacterium]|nr:Nif3-like dinuclear metal center hexameric protein [Gammaproteobacteria bacterium]